MTEDCSRTFLQLGTYSLVFARGGQGLPAEDWALCIASYLYL